MAEYQNVCIICHKEFAAQQIRAKYCSQRCRQTASRKYPGIVKQNPNRQKITDEQILRGIKDGLTRQEIADRYGVHVENLAKRMQRLGVYATHKKLEDNPGNFPKMYGECWHYVPSVDQLVKDKHPQFIYLETQRKDQTKKHRLKCRKCGSIVERSASTVRQKNIICEHCAEVEQQKIDLQNERIKLMRFLYALEKAKTPQTCECCGKIFYSQYTKKYCSDKCKKKQKRRCYGSIRRRCRKYNVYYDPSVTSVKIFARDQYRCKICGLMCNTEDNTWNRSFGPFSPTVDHIIPLVKGGTHTWDNVQCAHAICNSDKRDLITV